MRDESYSGVVAARMLHDITRADIERSGPNESVMVRAGLLDEILTALSTPVLKVDAVAFDLETKLWAIIDADGLTGTPSDICVAVEQLARAARNRDMWKGQCERQAAQLAALASPASPGAQGVREAGQFLLDRLVDHEVRMTSDEDAREWAGHVTPAMARLRSALSASGEGGWK
jgi:hypothetical protein